jgi:predicted RNA binding protein YcfA (HicA-like mRNA interferase family)
MRLPPALRGVPVRALVAALERDGFVLDRQSGSHRIYFNPADQRRAVVPWKSQLKGSDLDIAVCRRYASP